VQPNPVKTKLAAGGAAFGTMAFEFFTPSLAQIVKAAGADFILYDMEHSGVGVETMKAQFASCRGIGLPAFARVPATQYHFIARMLDVGALGIMVPMVETREQAELIVSCTRYPPTGRRGAAFGFAHDDYLGGSVAEKIAIAHERTLVICLIETELGIRNIDKIAAVPGVDVLLIGTNDLSLEMGIAGQYGDPKVVQAYETVLAACRKHGKHLGMGGIYDHPTMEKYVRMGARFVLGGSDVTLLMAGAQARAEFLRSVHP